MFELITTHPFLFLILRDNDTFALHILLTPRGTCRSILKQTIKTGTHARLISVKQIKRRKHRPQTTISKHEEIETLRTMLRLPSRPHKHEPPRRLLVEPAEILLETQDSIQTQHTHSPSQNAVATNFKSRAASTHTPPSSSNSRPSLAQPIRQDESRTAQSVRTTVRYERPVKPSNETTDVPSER